MALLAIPCPPCSGTIKLLETGTCRWLQDLLKRKCGQSEAAAEPYLKEGPQCMGQTGVWLDVPDGQ